MRRLTLACSLGLVTLAATASTASAAWQRSEFEITSERTDATTTFKKYEDQKKQEQQQQQQQQPTSQQPTSQQPTSQQPQATPQTAQPEPEKTDGK